ncbi:ABC transporter ATP-binding protein [Treponema phagedenis]|uniref:ABC transporter ATP-binding protein n=1 Tax=Treponema phagedenis TaxID=162 RepID=A0A0B7GZ12_TREPH|nr:ABC transporter ATP-binding protein [Treponema phagedenis]QEJ97060.1 ABC transporter ATP-binding protein [Treponema phagedenis]QEK02970.1 ABC transporter ATP-binding protein [Treponema phagedenis]QEK08599.1 ABC transporter ATP-binding protein [Treponema phagedenis]QSH95638.1 ABC transporter ATP-binding protein [Treponema phagedenis]QSH98791.1 ABC transporter ATP-binding protein [Treponema phagedenis]
MITKMQKLFGVTETGARGCIRAALMCLLANIAFIAPVFLIMIFVQSLLEGQLQSSYFYIAGIVIIGIIMYIIIYINYNTLYTETYKESAALRIEIANTLKELPLSFFSKHDVSDLSQTVMADIAAIEHGLSHAIPQTIGLTLFLIIMGIMMISFHPALGLCVFAPIIISIILMLLSKKIQVSGTTKHYHSMRERSEDFQEAIELQQEIKSYGRTEETAANLYKIADETEKIHIKAELMQVGPLQVALLILRFSIGLTVFFGLQFYLAGTVPLLYLLGYIIAAARITDAVSGVEANLAEIMYLDARIKRINELRDTPVQEGEAAELSSFNIEFKDVEFSYNKDAKVIDGISFTAAQNKVTALVGPSGCGKTTVLRLASRLYDYDKGHILIGEKEINKIDTDSLFDKISIVFQDVLLFNASVMENIRIGNKNASDEEVKEAARLANCTDFIEALPEGYNTAIGENGSKLSGGERQRLSIARAFLKNAPIIILDEISASLDVENEMKIQESLNTLIKDKTVIIISHRLKSIEKADKIIVMNEGKIEAEGTHAELLKTSALYRAMIEKSGLTEAYSY